MQLTLEYRLKNNTYTYLKDVSNVQRSGDILTYTHEGINLTINIKDVIYLKLNYLEVTHD